MNKNIVERILHECGYAGIKDVSYRRVYAEYTYEYMFQFDANIAETELKLMICIPKRWNETLFHLYVVNYKEIDFIPHIEDDGKICLYELEGVLIEYDFEGLLYQLLNKMNQVLETGLYKSNRVDFITEFQSYWAYLPRMRKLTSMVSIVEYAKEIYYTKSNTKKTRNKNEKYFEYRKRVKEKLYSADEMVLLTKYTSNSPIKKGVYLFIITNKFIYPPDWRESDALNINYINNILSNSVNPIEKANELMKDSSELLLTIAIKQPNKIITTISVFLENVKFSTSNGKPNIQSLKNLSPCYTYRADKNYLKGRTGMTLDTDVRKILIIGCGSIGGYLYTELLRAGYDNFYLVDEDILKYENIYRHVLGQEYVGMYKATALVEWTKKNYPFTKVDSVTEKIENCIVEGNFAIKDFDVIFSAVGNHNFNRWLNKHVVLNNLDLIVVYMWNEVFGIGNHMAIINKDNKGCYDCFFRIYQGEIACRASYCKQGQSFTKRMQACGTTYMPYSANTSVMMVAHGITEFNSYLRGSRETNLLVSVKGDATYLISEGFNPSKRYDEQKESIQRITGETFKYKECHICGNNN